MYFSEIMTLLTWPITILLSYFMVKLALKKFENKLEEED